MHCNLSFGSIGARAKLTGMPSHHHTVAIAPRDRSKSISGMRRETGSPCRNDSLGLLKRDAGRLKNHLLIIEYASTHEVCFFSLAGSVRAFSWLQSQLSKASYGARNDPLI